MVDMMQGTSRCLLFGGGVVTHECAGADSSVALDRKETLLNSAPGLYQAFLRCNGETSALHVRAEEGKRKHTKHTTK